MPDLLDLLRQANAATLKLNPLAFEGRIGDWLRGGLPGGSIPQGSPSAATRLPLPDGDDVKVEEVLTAYSVAMALAVQSLERCRILETAVLPELHMSAKALVEYHKRMSALADEQKVAKQTQCKNTHCQRWVQRTKVDPLLGGRCRRCHVYFEEHAEERPPELCSRDVDKEMKGRRAS